MSSTSLNIIVVGGSLGGLFAGVILKRLGHNVRILERSPTPLLHNQGAGLVCGSDLARWLEKHDHTNTPAAVVSPFRHYLDRQGLEIHREDWEQRMTSWDLVYNLLRANYDGSEASYIKPPKAKPGEGSAGYEYGYTVSAINQTDQGAIELSVRHVNDGESTQRADLIVAADGASSTIRQILEPQVERKYAGYVAWRGTAPESEISKEAQDALVEKFTFYHSKGIQILVYVIPGANGTLEHGKRLVNWVWYCNYAEDSLELAELMTDVDGQRHRVTLPVGKMSPQIWERQKGYASEILPPQVSEVVQKTQEPFVQAITDVISPRNVYFNGKVLLIGDAIAGFRPHTAASASQASFDALMLEEYLSGRMSLDKWEAETLEYARTVQAKGVMMGQRSQFGEHPLAR